MNKNISFAQKNKRASELLELMAEEYCQLEEEQNELASWVVAFAHTNGMAQGATTVYNAKNFLEARAREDRSLKDEINAAGYKSIGDLLGRHRRRLSSTDAVLEAYRADLPEWLHDAPAVRYGNDSGVAGRLNRFFKAFYPLVEDFFSKYGDDTASVENLKDEWEQCQTIENLEALRQDLGVFMSGLDDPDYIRQQKEREEERQNEPIAVSDLMNAALVKLEAFNEGIREELAFYAETTGFTIPRKEFILAEMHPLRAFESALESIAGYKLTYATWVTFEKLEKATSKNRWMSDDVTLQQLVRVIRAVGEAEPTSKYHEDLYEAGVAAYQELTGVNTAISHAENYSTDWDEEAAACLEALAAR